jgi:hypothetical protein
MLLRDIKANKFALNVTTRGQKATKSRVLVLGDPHAVCHDYATRSWKFHSQGVLSYSRYTNQLMDLTGLENLFTVRDPLSDYVDSEITEHLNNSMAEIYLSISNYLLFFFGDTPIMQRVLADEANVHRIIEDVTLRLYRKMYPKETKEDLEPKTDSESEIDEDDDGIDPDPERHLDDIVHINLQHFGGYDDDDDENRYRKMRKPSQRSKY